MDQESTADAGSEGQEPTAAGEPQGGEQSNGNTEGDPKVFSEDYVKSLRREAAQTRTKLTEAEGRLRELTDRDKSETERLSERASDLEARANTAEARLLRYEIGVDKGLDAEGMALLAGGTREEIEAHADRLKAWAGKQAEQSAPPMPKGFDGGARTTPASKGTPEQEHQATLLEVLGRAPQR
jgi:hypothetical protein